MATSVSFGSKGTWERLLSIPSSVLLQKLIPSCLPTQRTPYVATRMLLLHGSLETRSSQSIERRRPVAHTKCNMRIFDSCRHTTKRNFSNLLHFYLPRMCFSANELLFLENHRRTHTLSIYFHTFHWKTTVKSLVTVCRHISETGFRSTDTDRPQCLDLFSVVVSWAAK